MQIINQLAINKNKGFVKYQSNPNFGHQETVSAGSLERVFSTDSIDKSDNKISKKNIFFGLGILAVTGFATLYAIKKSQVKNVKNLQKTFQEIFFNDSITEKEAMAIKSRYLELSKIKDKNDYTRALFKEMKKDFGLENSNLSLEFSNIKGAGGGYSLKSHKIIITPDAHRCSMLETMCHEFRHAKQMEFAANLDSQLATQNIDNEILRKKIMTITDKYIDKGIKSVDVNDELINKIKQEAIDETLAERFGNLSPENIPQSQKQIAEKVLESIKNRKEPKKDLIGYWNSFHEKDARKSGSAFDRYINERAFCFDWVSDIEIKIRSLFCNKQKSGK